MVQYTLSLTREDNNQTYEYSHDLTLEQENSPERLLDPEFSNNIRLVLEQKSDCVITQELLKKILTAWIKDIKEGYRITSIKANLTPLKYKNLAKVQDSGNQEIPDLFEPDISEIKPMIGVLPPLNFI